MILEIAELSIQPGREDDFAAAYRQARPLVAATEGFRSARMTRGIESPSTFVLIIEWDSVEAHLKGFRESERFTRWRELLGPYFAADPQVRHTAEI
ncbi:antibiotic biosynthesis monooxygenase family protein [Pseudonocardia acaciae]|uniref:antibiotic biosynthesis monooxygenase family protein n=1 Tax=Pseudonocardia acaciae TaxID=551276 RepID=UPI00048E100C|nr:antibiotic biosynthesis monooxygenase family protein [Pseudonocardia acaciae]